MEVIERPKMVSVLDAGFQVPAKRSSTENTTTIARLMSQNLPDILAKNLELMDRNIRSRSRFIGQHDGVHD